MQIVQLDEALRGAGVRLVTQAKLPSPWSEAAKGLLQVEGVPFVRAGKSRNDVVPGARNVPALLIDDEPPRTGWAEIVGAVTRLTETPKLVPADVGTRAEMMGMCNEIAGEMGLGWCQRLLSIDAALRSDGARGFPKAVAEYLVPRYGFRPSWVEPARVRLVAVLRHLASWLHRQRARRYETYFDRLTVLDIYSATFIGVLAPLPESLCAFRADMRKAFAPTDATVADALDPILLSHRDWVYRNHLELPVRL